MMMMTMMAMVRHGRLLISMIIEDIGEEVFLISVHKKSTFFGGASRNRRIEREKSEKEKKEKKRKVKR